MLKTLILTVAIAAALTIPGVAQDKKAEKAKPYPLKTCVVSDEKLGGEHGEPYVFTHEGQELKLCCKPCLKDFKKDPAKYMKKVADAEKAGKK
jgi:YHS domain-containing protein